MVRRPNEAQDYGTMRAVAQKAVEETERERRTGAHVLHFAKQLGWKDDGEGALEFLLRRTREVALEDCLDRKDIDHG